MSTRDDLAAIVTLAALSVAITHHEQTAAVIKASGKAFVQAVTPWDVFDTVVHNAPGVHHFDPGLLTIDGFSLYLANRYGPHMAAPRHARPPADYLPITFDPEDIAPHLTDEDRDALRAIRELGV